MRAPKSTLDQWFTLQTVVEQGGYAQAADYLHRSQSSVSYSLHTLQERLGVALLEIVGRKAELTPEGRILLNHAQPLITAFSQLEARALAFAEGGKATLTLVVDSVFPKPLLFDALSQFQRSYPQTQVQLRETLRDESASLLAQRDADLYIVTLPSTAQVEGSFLLDVDFIAVARRDHPLHQLNGPLTHAELARFHAVILAEGSAPGNIPSSAWRFTTFDAAIEAVNYGVGYGWLPKARIAGQLASGELKVLPLINQQVRATSLYLVYGDNQGCFDIATRALADKVIGAVNKGQINSN
ncbi:DNA-binding transcriptional LysR family regulator [Serratia fonticola]|uniref:DNA-binding transcriptional LysR family regulator n=1 Tax=Serratia fonticola TaxID=47917 RepID=A0A542BLY5_SERFO|nr:LysR family transcriptional regulator [Serratia fonticola]TQI79610.1 DNA-binding transcriptional LysR family regulator [Serratia fonticola]TQI98364.1 DNA-binding transcriptional LysR family regulator [Serratia fonticola]TVZ67892.1 DNA-binding transcriptional LysR family regulator [Serratia fonticola]